MAIARRRRGGVVIRHSDTTSLLRQVLTGLGIADAGQSTFVSPLLLWRFEGDFYAPDDGTGSTGESSRPFVARFNMQNHLAFEAFWGR
ncbi:hypothetical protein NL676_019931 [Syzygium grande]|nr:hypothetical protein NL676_019931 [Syzygium grande]